MTFDFGATTTKLPRSLAFALSFLGVFVVLGAVLRTAFYLQFSGAADSLELGVLTSAFLLGARFDLRLGLLMLLPILLSSVSFRLSPFVFTDRRRRIWQGYWVIASATWVIFQIFDFAHYSYLGTKLSAGILNFLEDPRESANMVWESYPVVFLTIFWLFATGVLSVMTIRGMAWAASRPRWDGGRLRGVLVTILVSLAVLFGIHGRLSQYPLRWSDAYFHPNPLVPALALNPILNFFDTRKYRGNTYSLDKVRQGYPYMVDYLDVQASSPTGLNFNRSGRNSGPKISGQPNIVVVLLESFSAYKSSLTGNRLDPTPNLARLASQSVVFDHFYTPHSGTARGVFATLTGVPDVDMRNTSSRNPAAVGQHSLIGALKGYDAHYFIGGSTSWANVRGLIQKIIPNLTIHEEGSFKAPVVDVWGISDKSLFMEANEVFREAKRPFFAVIQTAGNHRPYTIPKTDTDFQLGTPAGEELKRNGFASIEEYNAFRYMDYCVQVFIEAARQERYYENTLFVFLGDHGIAATGHDVGPHMPKAYLDLKLSAVHTPLIIHAPKYLPPARHAKVGSQIDVMPTVLGLTEFPHRLSALGRDLFDERFDDRRMAFTIYHDGVGEIGLLDAEWYYVKKAGAASGKLHSLSSATPGTDLSGQYPETAATFNKMLDAYHQTAQYLLTNNRPVAHQ